MSCSAYCLSSNLLQHGISEPLDHENAFDAVFYLDTLEHIERLEKAVDSPLLPGVLYYRLPWCNLLMESLFVNRYLLSG